MDLFETLDRKLGLVMFYILMLVLPVSVFASGGQEISITVDGQSVDLSQPAIIQNGFVMAPLRDVLEPLAGDVSYDPLTRSITAIRGETRVVLFVNSNEAILNGEPKWLKTPPVMMGDRMLVPLRFVSEAFGALVGWESRDRVASIVSRTGGVDVLNPKSVIGPSSENAALTGRFISNVWTFPESAAPGQAINVGMNGTPGGTATLILSNGERIIMKEISHGYYMGIYHVPSDFRGNDLDLTVELQTPGGRIDTLTQVTDIRRE